MTKEDIDKVCKLLKEKLESPETTIYTTEEFINDFRKAMED